MDKNDNDGLAITVAKFFLPFIIAGVGLLSLYILVDKESVGKLFLLMFAYFFPPLGKESVIPAGVFGDKLSIPFVEGTVLIPKIDPLVMALSIAFVDIVVALFLLWNYDLAKKIPLIGSFMEKVERIGKRSSDKYSWIKPLRFIGIILFVMVPFQGSGGLVGSIIGRLIGMKPLNIFIGISMGTIIGCSLMAYFAEAIFSVLVKNFLLGLLIIIIIVIFVIMVYFYRKSRKNQNM